MSPLEIIGALALAYVPISEIVRFAMRRSEKKGAHEIQEEALLCRGCMGSCTELSRGHQNYAGGRVWDARYWCCNCGAPDYLNRQQVKRCFYCRYREPVTQ